MMTRWRWIQWCGVLALGYFSNSIMKKSFTVAIPQLINLGLTRTDFGRISSYYSIAYGISKFFGGLLCDQLGSSRQLFFFGIIVGALCNFSFSAAKAMPTFCSIWFVFGIVQGVGWPAMVNLVTENIQNDRVGTVWSLLTSAGNLGYMIGPFLLIPYLESGWQGPFRACGIGGICAAISIAVLMPASPTAIHFDCNKDKFGQRFAQDSDVSAQLSEKAYTSTVLAMMASPCVWCMLLSSALTNFTLKAMADWTGLYLVEHFDVSTESSARLMLMNEVGGMIGCALCGAISDRLGGRRQLTCCLFAAVCAVSLMVMLTVHDSRLVNMTSEPTELQGRDPIYHCSTPHWANQSIIESVAGSVGASTWFDGSDSHDSSGYSIASTLTGDATGAVGATTSNVDVWLRQRLDMEPQVPPTLVLALFMAGLAVNGPKTLLTVSLKEVVPKGVQGTVLGILGLFGQMGATFAGAGVGQLLESRGWSSFLTAQTVASVAVAVLMAVSSAIAAVFASHGKECKAD